MNKELILPVRRITCGSARNPGNPTPYTLHPTPHTLHPTPYTLHPTPYTLHPTPYTLHPTPYTLHHLRELEEPGDDGPGLLAEETASRVRRVDPAVVWSDSANNSLLNREGLVPAKGS